MEKSNSVFIACSLDGYIADADGGIDYLDTFPEINQIDSGYESFISRMDALVMGRNSYEKVLSFNIPWPYSIPVFVLSNTLQEIPQELNTKVELLNGELSDILEQIHNKGHYRLYIDGGMLIQSFLKEDFIDELVITTIPVLLGGGIPLFGDLPEMMKLQCVETKLYFDTVVQNRYLRLR